MADAPKRIGIGVVGAGGIAGTHITGYKAVPGAELVAICDVVPGKAEAVAKEHGFKHAFTDYNEMMKLKEIDAVSVCTPNAFHKGPTLAALKAGKHVLCEKPIALNAVEGAEMVAAAKKAKKKLQIGLHFHFDPRVQALKRFINEGAVGRAYYTRVQALRVRGIPTWGVFTNKKLQGGGPVVDIGVHMLYAAMYLLGFPKPVSVSGQTFNFIGTAKPSYGAWGLWDHTKFEIEDSAMAFVRFENGHVLVLETSFTANIEKDVWNVQIFGDKGGVNYDPCQIIREENGSMTTALVTYPKAPKEHTAEVAAFIESIRENKPVRVPGEDALCVQRILDGIYK
ncbi:MAG TPA: Gfo/Idh/MocA family oxidoreductase, partial [Planctomycetota bacterium]|nr:Gfo/Idh/MocA family oxidoreductase [Planctomycetota bacterium]